MKNNDEDDTEFKAFSYRVHRHIDQVCAQAEADHRARGPFGRWLFRRIDDYYALKLSLRLSLARKFRRFRK